MNTIIITPKKKQDIPFLKHLLTSLNEVKKIEVKNTTDGRIAKSIKSGLNDAKDILAGKKKAKTLKELLNED